MSDRFMKRQLLILITLFLLVLSGCIEDSITLKGASEIEIGESMFLEAETTKKDSHFLWESDHPEIALVQDGQVTGISEGKATITVMLADNETVRAQLEVIVMVPQKAIDTIARAKSYFDTVFPATAGNRILLPDNGNLNVIESIVYPNTATKLRPGTGTEGVKMNGGFKFIVIHDTGMSTPSDTAAGINQYIHAQAASADGRVASWHYTVGEDGIYQHVPDDEIAWHAGDGSGSWKSTDTGVKAINNGNVKVTLTDGYWTFDGIRSHLQAPLINGRTPATGDLVDSGILATVGENGNYFLGSTYYNSEYRKIANLGGNGNGIGIETCINQDGNYQHTLNKTAKLVAYLLHKYHLNISSVTQHNNFSGKGCPATIRSSAGRWEEFLKNVEFQLSLYDYEKPLSFRFEIDNPEAIDIFGNVNPNLINDETVNISVILEAGTVSETYHYQVIAKGMTTDEKISTLYADLVKNQIPRKISGNIILPTYNELYRAEMTWSSDNPEIFSDTGEYHQPDQLTFVNLYVTITIQGVSLTKRMVVEIS